jgi:hypothetical protein
MEVCGRVHLQGGRYSKVVFNTVWLYRHSYMYMSSLMVDIETISNLLDIFAYIFEFLQVSTHVQASYIGFILSWLVNSLFIFLRRLFMIIKTIIIIYYICKSMSNAIEFTLLFQVIWILTVKSLYFSTFLVTKKRVLSMANLLLCLNSINLYQH